MVNVVSHKHGAATESDEDIESQESELTEILHDVNLPINESRFGDMLPNNTRDTTALRLSKKLVKSFKAVTKFKATGKRNSVKLKNFLSEMAREKPTRYSLKQLKSFTRNFHSKLGMGGFGNVYKGELPNGMQVAIKVFRNSYKEEQFMSEMSFMAEMSILGRTYHRNLIRLFGFCIDANIIALVYEYAENGSLAKILYDNNCIIDWEILYHIAIQTARVISYLHEDCEQMIIHYDIKPHNILLDSHFSPRLADFGLAELYDKENTCDISFVLRGTHGYVAPELVSGAPGVPLKCDVYSFGVVLFEIVGRTRNREYDCCYARSFAEQVWDEFEKGNLENFLAEHGIEENYREQAKRMSMAALWCVQCRPEDRPTMSTVVNILKGYIEVRNPPNPFHSFSNVISSSSDSTRPEEVIDSIANIHSCSE